MKTFGMCSLVVFAAFWAAAPALAGEGKAKPNSDELFSPPQVLALKIDIPAEGLEALAKERKQYVKASLQEGDRTLANIGLRYKGPHSLGGALKPSFTLKLNEFISGQKFHGLSKLMLDGCPTDPTHLSAALANELYRAAGVPAPRAAFAHLTVNGKDLGLYTLVEGINRDFLGQYFERTKGNLYEGDGTDITAKLDKDSGDPAKDQPDVEALAKAAQVSDPTRRWTDLEKMLDLDRFISFLAVETLAWHTNGYSLRTNKYRLYHDPTSGRMVFLPHGTEPAFAAADGPLFPPTVGVVARAVLATPEGKRLYRERLAKLLANPCKVETVTARLNELAAKARPVVAKSGAAAAQEFDAAVAALRERIAKRAYLLEQELRRP